MEPEFLAIVLLLLGLLLIVAEFFVPSGGMIALMCVGCFIGSMYFAYRAWYNESPFLWWGYVTSFLVLVPGVIWGGIHLLSTTRLGDRVLLRAPELAEVTPYQSEVEQLSKFIGERGKTLSLMSPGGMVLVNGERLHASLEGTILEAGADIVVCGVSGTRVVVRSVSVDEPPTDRSTASEPDAAAGLDPFDDVDPWTERGQA